MGEAEIADVLHRYYRDNGKFLIGEEQIKEFGYDKADELLQKSRQTIKQLDFELIELIDHYKSLVEKLPN